MFAYQRLAFSLVLFIYWLFAKATTFWLLQNDYSVCLFVTASLFLLSPSFLFVLLSPSFIPLYFTCIAYFESDQPWRPSYWHHDEPFATRALFTLPFYILTLRWGLTLLLTVWQLAFSEIWYLQSIVYLGKYVI